jgi:hypothetical protein
MNVNTRKNTTNDKLPAAQCRQSNVIVRARAVAPVTKMMFNRVPSFFARRTECEIAAHHALTRL